MINPLERVVRDAHGGIVGMVAILAPDQYKARPLRWRCGTRLFPDYDSARDYVLSTVTATLEGLQP